MADGGRDHRAQVGGPRAAGRWGTFKDPTRPPGSRLVPGAGPPGPAAAGAAGGGGTRRRVTPGPFPGPGRAHRVRRICEGERPPGTSRSRPAKAGGHERRHPGRATPPPQTRPPSTRGPAVHRVRSAPERRRHGRTSPDWCPAPPTQRGAPSCPPGWDGSGPEDLVLPARPSPTPRPEARPPTPRPGTAGPPRFPWVTPWDPGGPCVPAGGTGSAWPRPHPAASNDGVCGLAGPWRPICTTISNRGLPPRAAQRGSGEVPNEAGPRAGDGKVRSAEGAQPPQPAPPRTPRRGRPLDSFRRGSRTGRSAGSAPSPLAGAAHSGG